MKGKRAEPVGAEPDGGEPGVFPGLDTDVEAGGDERAGATKRVCIATPALAASTENEDLALACRHLACLLAEQGHAVVVAHVEDTPTDERLAGEMRALYAGFGIACEPLPLPRSALATARTRAPAAAWTFLDWLRGCEPPFDVVHVPDWHGVGYGALLAKSLGLAFAATHFVVHGHAPLLWSAEGNRRFLTMKEELGWVFMERRSAELADTLVCRSAHLLRWMREAGYALPARSFVWPAPFPAPERPPEAVAARAERDGARLEEVVFFGRLEPHQGLDLFLRAIDRLARRGRSPGRIVFLDRRPGRGDVPEPVRDAAQRWPAEVRTVTGLGFEEAVEHLSRPGRLALMPSLPESSPMAVMACLREGIPFVATAMGGTPELVAPVCRARVLVAPDHVALGERVAELAGAPLHAARPRLGFERAREVWSRWHAQGAPFEAAARHFAQRARAAGSETPLVTVCVVHHERPELVRMAVDSVRAQDWPALETVLVDDGSESAAAQAALDAIEADFGTRGWRVIRQENRYLGAARNAAAAVARGEWLLFLDDDDVLFPDAVSRLVRAARFSGADCVPAARIHFSGDGDPRSGARPPGTLVRFLGAARGWCRFANVAGGACALVRRAAFETVGGFTEDYGIALEDLEFFNRLDRAGFRIEALPDPAYWYRQQPTTMSGMMSEPHVAEASRVRALSPYLTGRPGEERAFALHALFQFHDAPARIGGLREQVKSREETIRGLEGTIREIHDSISWKMSTPLRVLSARIGRLRRSCGLLFPKKTPREVERRHVKKAEALFWDGKTNDALHLWRALLARFPNDEALAGRARFAISILERLSDVEGYERRIDAYRKSRAPRPLKTGKEPRIAVYTAIAGGYDSVALPQFLDPRFDYVLFTDRPMPDTGVWQIRPMSYVNADDTRSARFVKTHPHRFLRDFDVAIWMDSNVMILDDFHDLVEGFRSSGRAVAAVPHPLRNSMYEECDACISRGKDDSRVIREQEDKYRKEGYVHDDLLESNFMFFDLGNGKTADFLDRWWREIDNHSRRDQLSANYALSKAGLDWYRLMDRPENVRSFPKFAFVKHDKGKGYGARLVDALKKETIDPYGGACYAQARDSRINRQGKRDVDVVVCVHDALEHVEACLDSVARNRGSAHQNLIIVDDGSSGPTRSFLKAFADSTPWCRLYRNERATGYPKAANQGMTASTGELVVLLNSDTVVTSGWIEKLADAVFSTPGAGIVGPMSNAASHQSVPEHRGRGNQTAVNALPPGLGPEDMNRCCERWTPAHVLPRVPLVHGFCFGVTRSVMDRIGLFDTENFPEGYGEENDYCFRASDAGFDLVVATHTYVFHAKSKSYPDERRIPLMKRASETFRRKYGRERIRRANLSMAENPFFVDLRARTQKLMEDGRRT